jgi:hypothetical protein
VSVVLCAPAATSALPVGGSTKGTKRSEAEAKHSHQEDTSDLFDERGGSARRGRSDGVRVNGDAFGRVPDRADSGWTALAAGRPSQDEKDSGHFNNIEPIGC